jgi:hypothetical protein
MQANNGNGVNLIPVRNGTTFSQWNMSLNGGKSQGPQDYPSVHVTATSGNTITYTIVNPQSITFDPTNPIYVQAGTTKPTSGLDSQFTYALSADNQGLANTVLTVTDANTHAGQYSYVMNFVNATALDPIIDNSGPGASFMSGYWAAGAVAVAALLVLYFITRSFAAKRTRMGDQTGPGTRVDDIDRNG